MPLSTSRYLLAALLVGASFAPVAAAPRRPPALSCYACIVIEAETGDVLWGRRPRAVLPNASTTKMVTALVTAKAAKGQEAVQVSSAAAAVGGGGLDLVAGDVFSVRDLLYALLLDSSNEAAAALAEHVSETQEAFVRRMNLYARRIGAATAHFENPHGLDASGHGASALDLALIGSKVLRDGRLSRIVATARMTITTPRGRVVVVNRNPLLETYRGADGIKTGQTSGAGNVLVASATRRNRSIVAVAMRAVDAADDARRLLDFGFAQPAPLPSPTPTEPTPSESATPSPTPTPEPEETVSAPPVTALVFDPAGAVDVVPHSSYTTLGSTPVATFVPSAQIVLPVEPGERVGVLRIERPDGGFEEIDAVAAAPVESDQPSVAAKVFATMLRAAATIAGGFTA